MQRTHSGREASVRRLALAAAAIGAILVATTAAALFTSHATAADAISVRVEGTKTTLVASTAVVLSGAKVIKNGIAADSCSGRSAAGALQQATHGDWSGTWSASYREYFLTAIDGLDFPSSGEDYWAFWVNDAPAPEGICSYDPKPGDALLFFPDCYGKHCPESAGVLGVKAPSVALVGTPFTVTVTAYSDAKGTPSKAVGATVRAGGLQAKTGAAGTATLRFTSAGAQTLRVSAPHAIRTEASVCVETAAAKTCG
jgi:uncharacterized protein DUF4430